MHGDTFELRRDAPHRVVAERQRRTGEALDPGAERGRVSNDGVAGDGFHEHDLLRRVTLRQECLYAAVLVAQHDFQMEDLLAIALEPKMAGFDHTRMHWPDGNLMNLLAFDEVKLVRFTIFPPIIGG